MKSGNILVFALFILFIRTPARALPQPVSNKIPGVRPLLAPSDISTANPLPAPSNLAEPINDLPSSVLPNSSQISADPTVLEPPKLGLSPKTARKRKSPLQVNLASPDLNQKMGQTAPIDSQSPFVYFDGGRLSVSEGFDVKLWKFKSAKSFLRTLKKINSPKAMRVFSEEDPRNWISVAVSPNGRQVVAGQWGGGENKVRLWDIDTGRVIKEFEGHADRVRAVAFSPDGEKILSGAHDGVVKLLDKNSGHIIHVLQHGGAVTSVAFSPDGRFLLSSSHDHSVRLWDAATGNQIREFLDRDWVWCAVFSPDGKSIASSGDHELRLWDTSSGEQIRQFKSDGSLHGFRRIAFSPDGRTLISDKDPGNLVWWNVRTGEKIETVSDDTYYAGIRSLAISPDGRRILVGTQSGLFLVDAISGRQILRIKHGEEIKNGNVESSVFLPNGGQVLSAGWDGTLKLWDLSLLNRIPGIKISDLAQSLLNFSNHYATMAASVLREVCKVGAQVRNSFWRPLQQHILINSTESGSLRALPNSEFWFQDGEKTLKDRMPTLGRLLRNPTGRANLMAILSQLRLIYPYLNDHQRFLGDNLMDDLPITWAQKTGNEFRLNELHIVPVSESFRRHIIYVQDAAGLFAVEIKIPGERSDRDTIRPTHFTVAKEIWGSNPQPPNVVKPLYYGQFQGDVRMYGKKLRFGREEPLGIMIFQYEDGSRLMRIGDVGMILNLDRLTFRKLAVSPKRLHFQVLVDAAVAAIGLHRLGWQGSTRRGNDMHSENIRILSSGRGVLVGDFGSFERLNPAMHQRMRETLFLISDIDEDTRAKMYPLVLEQLAQGITDPVQLDQLKREVRQELNLHDIQTVDQNL